MQSEAVVGFWSYAHDDNRLDGGAILELSRLIADQYDLLSGEPLEIFVDKTSLDWGDKWRERIDSALSQTTFFIPVITPRYFTREECRRELLEFSSQAKSLGVDELLLPILYVEVEDLSPDNSDEAVALVANTQYVDWRKTRLMEPSSKGYRTAVDSLARRLLKIKKEVAQKQLAREVDANLEDNGADGIAEIVADISKLLPEWLDAVQGEAVNGAQMDATVHSLLKPIIRLQKSHAPASAILAAQIRFAKEMLPLAERKQKDARVYLTRSIQLDPLVSALARLVSEHQDSFSLAAPVRAAIDEAAAAIKRGEQQSRLPGAHTVSSHFEDWRHLGRIFQKNYAVLVDGSRLGQEGNEIVMRWDAELRIS